MAKKFFSVIIVPHSKTNFKTLTFSKRSMKGLVGGAAIVLVVLAVFLVDYFSMTAIRSKYRTLARENTEQKEMISHYEGSIKRLKSTVSSFESYAKKLNIMMGFKSPDVILGEPGLGGGDPGPEGAAEPAPDPQTISFSAIQNLTQKADSVEKNLGSLVNMLESQTARLATTPTIWPAQGWVSSPFGYRIDPFTGKRTFHRGIDIATNFGNPTVATADGNVIEAAYDKFFGRTVIISHGGGIVTQYCHLDKYIVKAGQRIKRGDLLGYVGKTGKALGPHLHYEVRINDASVNPYNYILEE
jgi:murein DD-endopeptidase MepM/ murein hydrolase activator NlpD